MAGVRPSGEVIHFGVFELDCRGGELRRQGAKIKLQEQPLQILLILLQRPGDVVTREELRQRIWPSDTFVDFDHGLYNAVKRLREALGDDAERPQYVETLPRRGYRFIAKSEVEPPAAAGRIQSLAVLPLENLSRNPEQDYFAEGLTEALITTLAKIGELRVVSRTSAMQYKGVHKPLCEIARELDVDGIVEGTVLRVGERARITAQLIDASKETHLWAESYERDLRDVLALQSEVAQAIVREVRIKLTPQEQAHIEQVRRVDPEAYEAYLRGRHHWNMRSREGFAKAAQHFRDAIAKDPTYASAYTGLADCVSILGFWSLVAPDEGCGKAKNLAQKALQMDHGLAEAHTSLAFATMFYDYDFATAEREFERSVALNPQYPMAHHLFGWCLALMGRHEEAYTELKRATRLDPRSSVLCWGFGFVYRRARRYDEAVEQYQKAIELDPNSAQAHAGLGMTYLNKSLHELAVATLRKGVELSQGAPPFVAFLAEAYAAAGDLENAQKMLEQLQELSTQRYVTPYGVGRVYAALGKNDEALHWLETAYRKHDPWTVFLKTDPGFEALHGEARFQDLLRRMNYPP